MSRLRYPYPHLLVPCVCEGPIDDASDVVMVPMTRGDVAELHRVLAVLKPIVEKIDAKQRPAVAAVLDEPDDDMPV